MDPDELDDEGDNLYLTAQQWALFKVVVLGIVVGVIAGLLLFRLLHDVIGLGR